MKQEPVRRDNGEGHSVEAFSDESASGSAGETSAHGVNADAGVASRLETLERQNRRTRLLLLALVVLLGIMAFSQFAPESIIVRQTLMESEELKLVDSSGTTRLFLRMYSHVPVLQLLDSKGKPRLSMGIRFDDTPFIDMSDKTGQTRATFEMTEEDEPTIRLYDQQGRPSFAIN